MSTPIFDPRIVPSQPLVNFIAKPAFESKQMGKPSRELIQSALVAQADPAFQKYLSQQAQIIQRDDFNVEQARQAAVLILLIDTPNDWQVVLTVRAQHLRHHGGQISFVGGAIDSGETITQAALREANEEIGLASDVVDVLGALNTYRTITGFDVSPVVATIDANVWTNQQLNINHEEVDHLFTVPLSVVSDPHKIHVHQYDWERRSRQYFSVAYQDYFIWGASMAMLRNLDMLLTAYKEYILTTDHVDAQ